MPISTIADATSLLIIRDLPVTKVRDGWEVQGQVLSGKELVQLARQLDGGEAKPSKYGAVRTEVDGVAFASKAEARRYQQLHAMEEAGQITNLELQPRYELQPSFVDSDGTRHRPIYYIGDFAYLEKGRIVCEDVKGMATDLYKLKVKLAKHTYPHVSFREVKA